MSNNELLKLLKESAEFLNGTPGVGLTVVSARGLAPSKYLKIPSGYIKKTDGTLWPSGTLGSEILEGIGYFSATGTFEKIRDVTVENSKMDDVPEFWIDFITVNKADFTTSPAECTAIRCAIVMANWIGTESVVVDAQSARANQGEVTNIISMINAAYSVVYASATMFRSTNHHTGSDKISGFLLRVLVATKWPFSNGIPANEIYDAVHAFNTHTLLAMIDPKKVVTRYVTGLRAPVYVKPDESVKMRTSSAPAGTHKIVIAHAALQLIARPGFLSQMPHAEFASEVHDMARQVYRYGIRGHVGAAYIFKHNKLDGIPGAIKIITAKPLDQNSSLNSDLYNAIALYVTTVCSGSTLAKSPSIALAAASCNDPGWKRLCITIAKESTRALNDKTVTSIVMMSGSTRGVLSDLLTHVAEMPVFTDYIGCLNIYLPLAVMTRYIPVPKNIRPRTDDAEFPLARWSDLCATYPAHFEQNGLVSVVDAITELRRHIKTMRSKMPGPRAKRSDDDDDDDNGGDPKDTLATASSTAPAVVPGSIPGATDPSHKKFRAAESPSPGPADVSMAHEASVSINSDEEYKQVLDFLAKLYNSAKKVGITMPQNYIDATKRLRNSNFANSADELMNLHKRAIDFVNEMGSQLNPPIVFEAWREREVD